MPRVCFNVSDREHRAFKAACAKQGVTMNEGGRMLLAFYASGLLCNLEDAGQAGVGNGLEVAAQHICNWLAARWRDAD